MGEKEKNLISFFFFSSTIAQKVAPLNLTAARAWAAWSQTLMKWEESESSAEGEGVRLVTAVGVLGAD